MKVTHLVQPIIFNGACQLAANGMNPEVATQRAIKIWEILDERAQKEKQRQKEEYNENRLSSLSSELNKLYTDRATAQRADDWSQSVRLGDRIQSVQDNIRRVRRELYKEEQVVEDVERPDESTEEVPPEQAEIAQLQEEVEDAEDALDEAEAIAHDAREDMIDAEGEIADAQRRLDRAKARLEAELELAKRKKAK